MDKRLARLRRILRLALLRNDLVAIAVTEAQIDGLR